MMMTKKLTQTQKNKKKKTWGRFGDKYYESEGLTM